MTVWLHSEALLETYWIIQRAQSWREVLGAAMGLYCRYVCTVLELLLSWFQMVTQPLAALLAWQNFEVRSRAKKVDTWSQTLKTTYYSIFTFFTTYCYIQFLDMMLPHLRCLVSSLISLHISVVLRCCHFRGLGFRSSRVLLRWGLIIYTKMCEGRK